MTFGVSRNNGEFEWSGTSLSSIFAQRSNILKPSMWRMLFDIIRFNTFALDLLEKESATAETEETLGSYLDREGYSQSFKDNYLLPMTAAVWSTSPDKCALTFPVITLIRFMHVTPLILLHGGKERHKANRNQVEPPPPLNNFPTTKMAHNPRRRQSLHRRNHTKDPTPPNPPLNTNHQRPRRHKRTSPRIRQTGRTRVRVRVRPRNPRDSRRSSPFAPRGRYTTRASDPRRF